MKTLYLIVFSLFIFSCGKKNSTEVNKISNSKQFNPDSATLSNTYDIQKGIKNRNQVMPKEEKITTGVDLVNTPVFSGKVATAADVKSGEAIFSLDPKGKKHQAANINLPFYVIMNDKGEEVTAIIVQAEILGSDTIYGFKNGKGITGMCTSAEFRLP